MSFTATILRSYTDSSKLPIQFQETVIDDTQLPAFDGQIAAATPTLSVSRNASAPPTKLKHVIEPINQERSRWCRPSGSVKAKAMEITVKTAKTTIARVRHTRTASGAVSTDGSSLGPWKSCASEM